MLGIEDEDLDEVNVKGPEQFGGGVVDDDDPARKKAMARAKALALQGKKDANEQRAFIKLINRISFKPK